MDKFDDVRVALAKMTPGEWRHHTNALGGIEFGQGAEWIRAFDSEGSWVVASLDFGTDESPTAQQLADAAGIVTLRNRMADVLAERDKLAAEVKRLRAGLQGLLEIQDVLDERGSCENEFIVPRVSAARAALKETGHDA